MLGRTVLCGEVVHVADVQADASPCMRLAYFFCRSLFVWNVATVGIAMVLLSLVLNDASAVEHAARSGLYCRSLAPSPVD